MNCGALAAADDADVIGTTFGSIGRRGPSRRSPTGACDDAESVSGSACVDGVAMSSTNISIARSCLRSPSGGTSTETRRPSADSTRLRGSALRGSRVTHTMSSRSGGMPKRWNSSCVTRALVMPRIDGSTIMMNRPPCMTNGRTAAANGWGASTMMIDLRVARSSATACTSAGLIVKPPCSVAVISTMVVRPSSMNAMFGVVRAASSARTLSSSTAVARRPTRSPSTIATSIRLPRCVAASTQRLVAPAPPLEPTTIATFAFIG